jgi:hypothetical protein
MLSIREQSRQLLNLATATIDGTHLPATELLAEALPLAKRNDMYFYVLSLLRATVDTKKIADVDEEHARLARRQQYVELETGRLSQFFAVRNLSVVFIKDFMRYPFTDHDVDFIAIQRLAVSTYRTTMEEAGYRYQFRKSQIREPDKYFYYPLHADHEFADIRFHLHKALSWNGVVFLDSGAVLAHCREEKRAGGSFLVPGHEDEILIMAAHAVFENASLHIGEILQFGLLVRDEKIDWEYVVDVASQHNWQAGLAFFVKAVWTVLTDSHRVKPTGFIDEWAVRTLSDVGVGNVLSSGDIVFPHQIPYALSMKLYIDKMRRDIMQSRLPPKALFREVLSFLVFVWLSRLKKRMVR